MKLGKQLCLLVFVTWIYSVTRILLDQWIANVLQKDNKNKKPGLKLLLALCDFGPAPSCVLIQ